MSPPRELRGHRGIGPVIEAIALVAADDFSARCDLIASRGSSPGPRTALSASGADIETEIAPVWRALRFRLDDVPADVVLRMNALILDHLRVVTIGARLPWSVASRRLTLALGEQSPRATLESGPGERPAQVGAGLDNLRATAKVEPRPVLTQLSYR